MNQSQHLFLSSVLISPLEFGSHELVVHTAVAEIGIAMLITFPLSSDLLATVLVDQRRSTANCGSHTHNWNKILESFFSVPHSPEFEPQSPIEPPQLNTE